MFLMNKQESKFLNTPLQQQQKKKVYSFPQKKHMHMILPTYFKILCMYFTWITSFAWVRTS